MNIGDFLTPIGTGIGSLFKKKTPEPVLKFPIGEGLTPEQKVKAQEVISKPQVSIGEYLTPIGKIKKLVSGFLLPTNQEVYNSSYDEAIKLGKDEKVAQQIAGRLAKNPIFSNLSDIGITPEEQLKVSGPTIKRVAPLVAGGIMSKAPESIIAEEGQVAIQKLTNAIKEAVPVRKAQEAIYTAERGAKISTAKAIGEQTSGEAGFIAQKSALAGEMTKVNFAPIKEQLSQENIDTIFNVVKQSPVINEWQKITVGTGLQKMLTGTVPTEGELLLMKRVFPEEMITSLKSLQPFKEKLSQTISQIANIPRSVMASFDLSAPFRQGLVLGARRPGIFFKEFPAMFKSFGSEEAFKGVQQNIMKMPTFDLMNEGKLALTEMDVALAQREERFMSQWAEKIPVVGKVIRASGRAYTGFLNKLRADNFEYLINKADGLGLQPRSNPQLVKEIATFVNVASGRGSLGKLQPAATALNAFFFSPRLASSRLTLLNPLYYVKASPLIRQEALKSMLSLGGVGVTILGLAKLAGAEVETRPTSSDFGKIKIGETRIDPWGGFQQYVRMFSQLVTGKYISSTTGKELTLGEGYKPLSRFDILLRQIESKEAPIFSFATLLLKQQDYQGKPISVPKEVSERFIPMIIQDAIEVYKNDPSMLPIEIFGIFGMGMQTYEKQKGLPSLPSLPKLPSLPSLPKLPSLK